MTNKMADKKKNASQVSTTAAVPLAKKSEREKEQSRSAKGVTRERENTSGRHESKRPSELQIRFRNNRIVRFARDAYHELRYKVTWPTFVEARNMTLVVIALSTAIGVLLGLVDGGLTKLFLLLTGQ